MVKGIEKLTDRQVRNLKTPGRYPDGATLYLVVWPSGSKSWVQRLTIGGRRADLGLGGYPAMSLAQARRRAQDNRSLAKSGGDPLAEKREEAMVAAMPTFEALAQQHIAENRHAWRNAKHAGQWLSTLETYAFPSIGAVKVNEVSRKQVVDALSPIWHTKAETARRVRQRIRAVMDRAVALEYIDYNPAGDAINGALTKMPRVRAHHRALPYRELPAALEAVRGSTASPSVKLAFELLALTGCISGELRGMTWDEVDLETATWTVPGERMKAGKLHRVPLSLRALAILREAHSLNQGEGVVFPAPRSGGILSDMAFTQMLRRLGLSFVPHGLRSTFRDWAAEQTDAPHAVMETALAHTVGNATEAAYARSDLFELRRGLMDKWGAYLEGGTNG
jgi:integrase